MPQQGTLLNSLNTALYYYFRNSKKIKSRIHSISLVEFTSISFFTPWFLDMKVLRQHNCSSRCPSLQWTDRPGARRQLQRLSDSGVAPVTAET